MKIVISTLFLVFLVFLGSIQLSSQSGTGGGPSRTSNHASGGRRIGNTTFYPNLRAGAEIRLPNGQYFVSNGTGEILVTYTNPRQNIRIKQGETLVVIGPDGRLIQPGQPGYNSL